MARIIVFLALSVSAQSGWELSNLSPNESKQFQDQEQFWSL